MVVSKRRKAIVDGVSGLNKSIGESLKEKDKSSVTSSSL
jgi:hypothetical protein